MIRLRRRISVARGAKSFRIMDGRELTAWRAGTDGLPGGSCRAGADRLPGGSWRAGAGGLPGGDWRAGAGRLKRMAFELAQVNIGRLTAPVDSPVLAGFMAALDPGNAAAEQAQI